MSLESIITQVAVLQAAITGITRAYDNTPDSINDFPCFINIPASGTIERQPHTRITTHSIKMQLFVIRHANLPSAETKLRPFVALTLDKFDANLTLGATCWSSWITHYDYGVLTFGGRQYLGIVFDLEAIEREAKTFLDA